MKDNSADNSFAEPETVIGMIASRSQSAWAAFKERANIGLKNRICLAYVEPTVENRERILNDDKISCKLWTGSSMQEVEMKAPKAYYDRTEMSRRTSATEEILLMLQQKGVLFINPPAFRELCADKWETYKLLKHNKIATPETFLFSEESLEHMLDKTSGFVFIKKRRSSQGKNQVVIRELSDESYLLTPSEITAKPKEVRGLARVVNELERRGINDSYIVQEGIDVENLSERIYDFRAIFQRGKAGRLGMTCFYVRVGAPASDQANIGKGGHPQDPYLVFQDYKDIEQRVRKLGQRCNSALMKSHVFGEIALDFVFNDKQELIVIEANSKPGSKGLQTLREWNPKETKYQEQNAIPLVYDNKIRELWGGRLRHFIQNPLLYGKYLAATKKEHEP